MASAWLVLVAVLADQVVEGGLGVQHRRPELPGPRLAPGGGLTRCGSSPRPAIPSASASRRAGSIVTTHARRPDRAPRGRALRQWSSCRHRPARRRPLLVPCAPPRCPCRPSPRLRPVALPSRPLGSCRRRRQVQDALGEGVGEALQLRGPSWALKQNGSSSCGSGSACARRATCSACASWRRARNCPAAARSASSPSLSRAYRLG